MRVLSSPHPGLISSSPKNFGIALYRYQVHSDSTARDLRYDFDAVAYLRDARGRRPARRPGRPRRRPARIDPRYLQPQALW